MTKLLALAALVVFSLTTSKGFAAGFVPTNKPIVSSNPAAIPPMVYYGGPVLGHVKVVVVFWGPNVNDEIKTGIVPFYKAIVNSTHLDWLDQYDTNIKSSSGTNGTNQNIGRGSYYGEITIQPKEVGTSLDKKKVEAELVYQIDKKVLPVPDADTLYMIHFPKGITLYTGKYASCKEWCGDHEGFVSQNYGNIAYAMMPDIGGICKFSCGLISSSSFNSMTVIVSHELVEAITDPMCPEIDATPAAPAAWLRADNQEVGDVCTESQATLTAGKVVYQIQGEWDKDAQNCRGGNYTSP